MSNQVKRLTLSAFFLALGLVLPFAFHSFGPQAGAVFPADAYSCAAVRVCLWAGLRSAGRCRNTATFQCIDRYAAIDADRDCHVSGAGSLWLVKRIHDKKATAVSFFNYHHACRKSSQRTGKSGAAEYGGEGLYTAYFSDRSFHNCDTGHFTAAGNRTAAGKRCKKGRGQKSGGLMYARFLQLYRWRFCIKRAG